MNERQFHGMSVSIQLPGQFHGSLEVTPAVRTTYGTEKESQSPLFIVTDTDLLPTGRRIGIHVHLTEIRSFRAITLLLKQYALGVDATEAIATLRIIKAPCSTQKIIAEKPGRTVGAGPAFRLAANSGCLPANLSLRAISVLIAARFDTPATPQHEGYRQQNDMIAETAKFHP